MLGNPGSEELVIGIDFGTSSVRAAALVHGKIQTLVDSGEESIPAIVYYPRSSEPVVGKEAHRTIVSHPAQTVTSVKRVLGRGINEPEVRAFATSVSFPVRVGSTSKAVFRLWEEDLPPAKVVADLLARARKIAERRFGGEIHRAVIAAPAEATGEYLVALQRAAQLARIEVIQFVAEPVAAALAFGTQAPPGKRRIAICDFGGGNFNAAVLEQDGLAFRTLGYAGDTFLGGDDFDNVLAEEIAGVVLGRGKVRFHKGAARWRELILRCESVKRQLSMHTEARLRMKEVYFGEDVFDIDLLVERQWIRSRWQALSERAIAKTEELMKTVGWKVADVEEVVFVGGTMIVPLVKQAFTRYFGKQGRALTQADLVVAIGAALHAASHRTEDGGDSSLPALVK